MYPLHSDPPASFHHPNTQSVSSFSVPVSPSLVGSVQPFYPHGHPQAQTPTSYQLLQYQPSITNNNPSSQTSNSSWTSNTTATHYLQSNQSLLYPNSSSSSSVSSSSQHLNPYHHYHHAYPHPPPQPHYFFPTSMANPLTAVSSQKQKIVVLLPSSIDVAKVNIKQVASAACDALERTIPLEDMLITVSVTSLIDSGVSDTSTATRSMEGVVSDFHVNSDYALESSPDTATSTQSDSHHLLPSHVATSVSRSSDDLDLVLLEQTDLNTTQTESDNIPLPSPTLSGTSHDQLKHDVKDTPGSEWDTNNQNWAQNNSDSVIVNASTTNVTKIVKTTPSSTSITKPTTNDHQGGKRQSISNSTHLSDAELISRRAWDPKNATGASTASMPWFNIKKWCKTNNDTSSNRYEVNRSHRPNRDNHSAPAQQRHSDGFSHPQSSSRNKRQTHTSQIPESNSATVNDNKSRGNDNQQNHNSMNNSSKRGKTVKVSEAGSMTTSKESTSVSGSNNDKKSTGNQIYTSRPSRYTTVSHSSGLNFSDCDMPPHRVVLGNLNPSVDISDMERLSSRTTSLVYIHYPPKKQQFPGRAAVFFLKDPEDAMRFYVYLQACKNDGNLPSRFALPDGMEFEVRINSSSIPTQISQRYKTGGGSSTRDNHNHSTTTTQRNNTKNNNNNSIKPIQNANINNSDLREDVPVKESLRINDTNDTNQVASSISQDDKCKLENDHDTTNDDAALVSPISASSPPLSSTDSSCAPVNDVKSLSHSSVTGTDNSSHDSTIITQDDAAVVNVSESSSSSLAAA